MVDVLNLGDDEAAELATAVERHKLSALQGRPKTVVVAVCGRLEAELAEMEEKEAAELLASYGLKEPGLNRLIHATYDLLGLIPFFTAGKPEGRAWASRKGGTGGVGAGGGLNSTGEWVLIHEACRGGGVVAGWGVGRVAAGGHGRRRG